MQMNDVGTLKLRQSGDVGARVGKVHLEEVLAAELIGDEDAEPFPQEFQRLCPIVTHRKHREVVGLLVTYQHFCLDTIFFQGFHQSVGSDGCPTNPFGCVDN